uniref:histidine kinase n=1 Tax=Lotharella globosa TaxID=91324 RepID=A0A7S3YCE9_9EUKA
MNRYRKAIPTQDEAGRIQKTTLLRKHISPPGNRARIKSLDNLTRILSDTFESDFSLIALIDGINVYYLSCQGISLSELPRDITPCPHALHNPGKITYVADASKDIRFRDLPTVTSYPFWKTYVGMPIVVDGAPVGVVVSAYCKVRRKSLSYTQRAIMCLIAKAAADTLTLNSTVCKLQNIVDEMKISSKREQQFISTMAHELRTPTNAILGFTELLKSELQRGDMKEIEKHTDSIQFGAEILARTVNEVLDWAKLRSGKVHLDKTCENVGALVQTLHAFHSTSAARKGVELVLNLGDGIPDSVLVDRHKIAQLLNNLLSNAIKFTPSDKTVEVGLDFVVLNDEWKSPKEVIVVGPLATSSFANWKDAKRKNGVGKREAKRDFVGHKRGREEAVKTISTLRENEAHFALIIRVIDQGCGIAKDRIHAIFQRYEQGEPSTTRKHGGTGLGLSIVKRLLEMLKGHLFVQSSASGSSFTMLIPTKLGLVGAQQGHDETQRKRKRTTKNEPIEVPEDISILAAEDDLMSRKLLVKFLDRLGVKGAKVYKDGKELIDAVKGLHMTRPDRMMLVITDVNMPRLCGGDVLLEMKQMKLNHRPQVLAVTASAEDVKHDFDMVLDKPLRLKSLREALVSSIAKMIE